jgi:hypothetical protein
MPVFYLLDFSQPKGMRPGAITGACAISCADSPGGPADVVLVMIDGVLHKRDKRLLKIDVEKLLAEAEGVIGALRRRAIV